MLHVVSLAGNGISGVACATQNHQNDRVLTDLDISSNPISLGKAGLAHSIFDTLLGGSYCYNVDGRSKRLKKCKKPAPLRGNQISCV